MLWVDVAILALIGVSTVIGLMRGLVKEVLSLLAWVAAFWVAIVFAAELSPHLGFVSDSEVVRAIAAFVTLFLATLVVAALLNHLIAMLVKGTGLHGTDRVLGMGFGLLRGVVVVAALMVIGLVAEQQTEDWWRGSFMIDALDPVAVWMHGFLPSDIGA
ncbi:MAG: CvpA family protein [Gammaproteobacteria bacterium]